MVLPAELYAIIPTVELGKSYEFRVTAVNAAGRGEPSDASIAVCIKPTRGSCVYIDLLSLDDPVPVASRLRLMHCMLSFVFGSYSHTVYQLLCRLIFSLVLARCIFIPSLCTCFHFLVLIFLIFLSYARIFLIFLSYARS